MSHQHPNLHGAASSIGAVTTAGPQAAEAPVDPAPPRVHFPALDGYRALAALGVVLGHVALLSGLVVRNKTLGPYLARADVGVSIFFLLSGFLLYRPFVAARLAGRSSQGLGGYARRRALRILPAYWVAITVVAFVLHAPRFLSGHNIVAHYLLLHIYDTHHIAGGGFEITGGPVQQSWSLATELSFYVFLPIWAWLMARGSRSPERQLRVEAAGLVGLWVGAITLKSVALGLGMSAEHFGLFGAWLPFRLDEFALGMGMAVASAWIAHRRIELPARLRGAGPTIGCWIVAAALFWFTCTQLGLPVSPLFSSLQAFVVRIFYSFTALFLLLPAVFGRQGKGPVKALFANPVMAWLGLISYGIYIWHEAWQDRYLTHEHLHAFVAPFWQMLGWTLGFTILSAAASWYLVEKTALRFAGRRGGALTTAEATAVAVPEALDPRD